MPFQFIKGLSISDKVVYCSLQTRIRGDEYEFITYSFN